MKILSSKRRDFMRNAGLAAAAAFTPGMTFSQKADAVEEELEKRLQLAQASGGMEQRLKVLKFWLPQLCLLNPRLRTS